jgi:fatty acid desaturase
MLVRLHDKLYNLSKFAETHKGGKDFIERASKMTDATAIFESNHPGSSNILKSISHLEYKEPLYTMEEKGFYKTVSKKVNFFVKENKSQLDMYKSIYESMFWILCGVYYSLHIYLQSNPQFYMVIFMGIIQSFLKPILAGFGHNYMHLGDNRNVIFYVTGMSVDSWKWEHVHIHHVFTNTFLDPDWTAIKVLLKKVPKYIRIPVLYVKLLFNYILTFLSEPLNNGEHIIGRLILFIELYSFYTNPILLLLNVLIGGTWFLIIDFSNHYLEDTPEAYSTNLDWGEAQFVQSKDFWIVDYGIIDSMLGIGLGFQRPHHLFPKMSHSAYWLINPIIM